MRRSGDSTPRRFFRFSAFEATLSGLRDIVRDLEIDSAALNRPLSRCDLGRCRGACCHDGVCLDRDEVPVIEGLLANHRKEIEALGARLPPVPIVAGRRPDRTPGPKTATRPEPMAAAAENYPAHFPDTACVFLLPDARCALQQFATGRGLDPWHYKPATCWLHPLAIERGSASSHRLTMYDFESDPQRCPGYPGFASRTPCGVSPPSGGQPAWKVLTPELTRLGQIGGRDLLGEIRSGAGAAP